MEEKKEKRWQGSKPTNCELCNREFKKVFIDGRTTFGPWGLMCSLCHKINGTGLGIGRGQKYDLESLVKLEG